MKLVTRRRSSFGLDLSYWSPFIAGVCLLQTFQSTLSQETCPGLSGPKWCLTSNAEISSTFDDTGRVTGHTGCNDYVMRKSKVTSVEEKYCSTSIMNQESKFLRVLPTARYYSINCDDGPVGMSLYASDVGPPILTYEICATGGGSGGSILGKWTGTIMCPTSSCRSVMPRAPITVTFSDSDNGKTLAGSTGCNNFSTTFDFSSSGKSSPFGLIKQTEKDCSVDIMDQEEMFLELLDIVMDYTVDEYGTLGLFDGNGKRVMMLVRP